MAPDEPTVLRTEVRMPNTARFMVAVRDARIVEGFNEASPPFALATAAAIL
jgi:hypothetical protein